MRSMMAAAAVFCAGCWATASLAQYDLPSVDDPWATVPLGAIEESRPFAIAKVNSRHERCLRVFGHEWFCGCLRNNLGVGISFRQFVLFTMHSEAELGYVDWTPQEREVAEHIWSVRDLCVADSY